MSATRQVSHTRNVFLFRKFQINLQIALRWTGGHLVMSLVRMAVVVAVEILVLEGLPALWENVEIKGSG